MASLHDLGDAKFEDMFLHDPALNDFSNTIAESFCSQALEAFDEDQSFTRPGVQSRLQFAIKKLVFLFTNSENHADTLPSEDIIDVFVWPARQEVLSIAELAEILSTNMNWCMTIHKAKAQEVAGAEWDTLSQSDKVWRSLGEMIQDMEAGEDDGPADAVNVMMRKTISVIGGLEDSISADLYSHMMDLGVQKGCSLDDLREFRGVDRTSCFGFYWSRKQYCGVCKYYTADKTLDAVVVKTAGVLGGSWVFAVEEVQDSDELRVLAKHNGVPVAEFAGLQGMLLVEAVIRSVFTAVPDKQSLWRRIFG